MEWAYNDILLKTVLEETPSFKAVYDLAERKYKYINQVGLKMFELSDISELETVYPETFRKDGSDIADHIRLTDPSIFQNTRIEEALFRTHSGKEIWGTMQVSLFEVDNKQYYLIRIRDTSHRKESEQLIRDGENRFEALFMHAAIGIIMVDKEGKIILSNRFANVIFGYQVGELIGQQLEILIPQNVRASHKDTYKKYTDRPQSRPMGVGLDLKGRRKDGTLFPVEISLSHFSQGETPYFISFINDATFKKQAEYELLGKNSEIKKLNESLEKEVINRTNALVETLKTLEESKRELEIALSREKELGELKSRFVSMASHEFRTPLTTILSSASLLEKYPTESEQEKRDKHISRIKSSVGNLTDILEEFLSVGKLEEGKIQAQNSEFDLKELISETILDLKSIVKPGQVIEQHHNGEAFVFLDKSLLRKIIINLCSNAIKFSPEEAVIHINTRLEEAKFSISVIDSGIGISEEDKKYLFIRFFRGANVTNLQGTGLGLHIVARYAELMKGKVSVESKLNVGTTFTIDFDLR
ncbi:PAS domain S-box-containing protein [Pseudarcicella hirudinis]|uniref:histidine kinase n=1 Tax=Pseudarcicella hirudinis TaxID=1079859 RepID=A0A1I5TMM9_9BACT|nr:PAS domain S-box protein [Pseudarcicella hirudinis]SFP84238.1 PAS domain S-box-containing protein [Pseudarcicella hirudinis]